MPKRKRSSYDMAFKLKVVQHAETSGSNRKTADHFGVNERQVRDWRKAKEELLAHEKSSKRLKGAGKQVRDPELDKDLIIWVKENRKEGIAVSGKDLALEARRRTSDPSFKASSGWLDKFKKRHTLSTRQRTSIGQKLPLDYETKMMNFHKYVIKLRKIHQYHLRDIYNMDETPTRFDMPSTRTLHDIGEKTVHIKSTNSEKKGFTTVLTVRADGSKLKPWVIFKGVRDPKVSVRGVSVHVQKKGYIDENGCLDWIRSNFPRRTKDEPRRLLIWDSCSSHLTKGVKEELATRNIDMAVIPGGLTSILQPLDVSVNKPFKDNMRTLWNNWMTSGKAEYNTQGKRKPPTKETVVSWVGDAWSNISSSAITNGFLKCGIANSLDGEEDDYLYKEMLKSAENSEADNDSDTDLADLFASDSEEEEFEGFK